MHRDAGFLFPGERYLNESFKKNINISILTGIFGYGKEKINEATPHRRIRRTL